MKIKDREQFFVMDGEYDRKNKLLRSNVRLTEEEVRRLDSGKLSLEDLDILLAKKAKIFKYRTQITVHADFPGEVGSRVNGYAFLVNNKNGSVGIRYGAIDEAKRRRISRFLSYEGFLYQKNSTEHNFILVKTFSNRDQANGYVAELKPRYDYAALRSLIYGCIDIYGSEVWGRYYVVLSITINAIPEANIPEFLLLMRCKSEEEIALIEQQRLLERQQEEGARKDRQAQEAEEVRIKRIKLLEQMREKYTQVTAIPEGQYSLLVVTENLKNVVVKRSLLKNGKFIIRKFNQGGYGLKDFQQWNDVDPKPSCNDTSRMSDEALVKYIEEEAVFSK